MVWSKKMVRGNCSSVHTNSRVGPVPSELISEAGARVVGLSEISARAQKYVDFHGRSRFQWGLNTTHMKSETLKLFMT